MDVKLAAITAALALVVSGCGSWDPARGRDLRRHVMQGIAFENEGMWARARAEFLSAVEDESKDGSGNRLAQVDYEYGRCLGVTGHYGLAEVWLNKALDIDRRHGGPTYMDLTELARLQYDQGKFKEAIAYYRDLFVVLDRIDAKDFSPGGYSDLLAEYATALRSVGETEQADRKTFEIQRLAQRYPLQNSITDRTPYGKFPDQPGSGGGQASPG